EEGHAVILTDKLLNENEIIALASQLALNPALKIFYVFTSPEGEQDVDAFSASAAGLVAQVEKVFAASGVEMPDLRQRLTAEFAPRNGQAIKKRLDGIFSKKIEKDTRLIEAVKTDEGKSRGKYLILAANGTSSLIGAFTFQATVVTSDALGKSDLDIAQNFVAGRAAQNMTQELSNLPEIEGVLLREKNDQLQNVTYRVQKDALNGIGAVITKLVQAFESAASILRAA
ncbi:MAG TPA: hypothetical protein VL688_11285, partial [Verrucomicrobiae bacterium]|nr:hypothetical protein [Verrucomicrobiae bacterium]